MAGRNRDSTIKRQWLYCEKHGTTEHSEYTYGKERIQWRCMACLIDNNRQYRQRVVTGQHVPVPRSLVLEPTKSRQCSRCFVELGSAEGVDSGVCRECGDN